MTCTQIVLGGIGQGTVLETYVSDADLQRAIAAEPPHSKEVLEAYNRAKQAGEAWNMRSRRIVRQLWREREGDDAGAPALVGQTAIFDFKS